MNIGAVFYKGWFLLPNSQCYELFQAKKFKELEELMRQTDVKEKQLSERYNYE